MKLAKKLSVPLEQRWLPSNLNLNRESLGHMHSLNHWGPLWKTFDMKDTSLLKLICTRFNRSNKF
jgi:hypothetical protein